MLKQGIGLNFPAQLVGSVSQVSQHVQKLLAVLRITDFLGNNR